MTKEKQIEEMAKDILKCSCVGTCLECEYATVVEDDCACIDVKIAEGLYTAGYRKASEVAREFFEEIENLLRQCVGIIDEKLDDAVRAENYVTATLFSNEGDLVRAILRRIPELKKKYLEANNEQI